MNEQTRNDVIILIKGYKNLIKTEENKETVLYNKLKKDFPDLVSDNDEEEILSIIKEILN